ncbi:MAG: T9SS type A sorting domain-containing protein, partial [Prevotella sp.]|nr:T9SS type A sorting domain-containing protein [Prevotella sp.]
QAATTIEYAFQAIQKMTFGTEAVVGIKELRTQNERPFSSDGETVTFQSADRDLRVTIVRLNGMVVRDFTVRRGQQSSLSLRSLPTGVYMLNVNGVTYKVKTR